MIKIKRDGKELLQLSAASGNPCVFPATHFFSPGGVMQFGHKADNNVKLLN